MIYNLPELFLYQRIPAGVLDLDERGLLAALMGGIQDAVDDQRSYIHKLNSLLDPSALPDTGNNAVLVDLTSPQGVVYTRSLDIFDDTPASDSPELSSWVASQLGLTTDELSNVRYGRDPRRAVDVNTLGYLAGTVGAIIYQTATTDADAARKLLQTHFPRLRIKGTGQSFEVLARLLGFTDLVYAPLWGRLSPRDPNDPGSPVNDPDFAYEPQYYPHQDVSVLYDPLSQRDGAFYRWAGTVTNGTSDTRFYTSAVNGNNPWIEVVLLGDISNGTAAHIAAGTYVLAGGAPNTRAYVDPDGSSFRLRAIADGDTWNGLVVTSSGTESGSLVLSIYDRLSSIKYRTAYYALFPTVESARADEVFGQRPIRANPDLQADGTLTSDGTATSPYRPWIGGHVSAGSVVFDWLTSSGSITTTTLTARQQATGTNRELVYSSVVEAAKQVGAAMEEVRGATRIQRTTAGGLLFDEQAPYARYLSDGSLFTTSVGVLVYSGSHARTPGAPYVAEIAMHGPSGTVTAYGELSNGTGYYAFADVSPSVNGSYDFTTGEYTFTFSATPATGTTFWAHWTPTSTAVLREQPTDGEIGQDRSSTQLRPEDTFDEPVDVIVDDYPWLRAVVGNGELVELDTHRPEPESTYLTVEDRTDVYDHNGVPNTLYVVESSIGRHRFVSEVKATDKTYQPGKIAAGFTGSLRSLASYTEAMRSLLPLNTDFDTQFQSGYGIYTVGLVNGVLVADPMRFNAEHHRTGLVGWIPFNEHPDEALKPSDHVRTSVVAEVTGIDGDTDRVWDSDLGWYLSPKAGARVGFVNHRNIEDDCTIAFRFRDQVSLGTKSTIIVALGPVQFEYDGITGLITGRVLDEDGALITVGTAVTTGWALVYLRKTATEATFGTIEGGVQTESTVSGTYRMFGDEDTTLAIVADDPYDIQDLRIWNTCKSAEDLMAVADYGPRTTAVAYRLAEITTVDRSDVYGFEVLSSGRVVPGRLPAWNRTVAEARILRYTSSGSYVGPAAFEEVGVGANNILPDGYQLGYVFPFPDSSGTIATSGTSGAMPGMCTVWSNDTGGTVIIQLSGGSTANGSIAVSVPFSSTTWPPSEWQLNTAVDQAWVSGDDSSIYRITLVGSLTTTSLRADRLTHDRGDENITVNPILGSIIETGTYSSGGYSGTINYGTLAVITSGTTTSSINLTHLSTDYQLTGAVTTLAKSSVGLRIAATGSSAGVPYSGAVTGALQTPPLWMYLKERTTVDASSAWTTWIGGGVGYDENLFGNQTADHPDVPYQVPALDDNGQLDFENSVALSPGWYRLLLDAGSIGRTDPAFDGLSLEISINGSDWSALKILTDQSGYNPRSTTPFVFEVASTVPAPWLLSIRWTNAFSDNQHQTQRQLVVYGYTVDKLGGELWKVSIEGTPGSLVYANYTPNAGTVSTAVAGGWFMQYTNGGALSGLSHEVLTYDTTT